MTNQQITNFIANSHGRLNSIFENKLGIEAIKEWKKKLLPHLGNSSKIKISRIKILHMPEDSYFFSLYTDPHEKKIAEAVLRDTYFYHAKKTKKESIEAFKMLQAREENIDFEEELAEMICGYGDYFPHRHGQELTKFFQDLGYDSVNDGGYGKEWVKDQLEELNIQDIYKLVSKGLFRKKYFTNCEHSQYNMYVSYENAAKEFKEFMQNSLSANESLDLGSILDMSVNIELLFDNKANTEDQTLNDLITEAKERYLGNDKQVGLEKLWDAYERIKTIFKSEGLNKKLSAEKLSGLISENFDEGFINEEFSRLTDIGNGYRIRHHETGKKELTSEHINYFFFRMLSFIDLCLVFLNKEEVEVDLFE